ncbi:MAG: SH3 domain-containing protein [Spirochaetaceae bacterium]
MSCSADMGVAPRRATHRVFRAIALSLLAVAPLMGCGDRESVDGVELPTTPVLSFRAGWAVVEAGYTRILEQPDPDSDIVGHARRGAMLEILSTTNYTERVGDETDFWYQIRSDDFSGWVFGPSVALYDSRRRALNASRIMGDE